MYKNYKKARNLSQEVLLDAGITSLPVDSNQVLKALDVNVFLYQDADFDADSPKLRDSDGFTTLVGYKKAIYLNE